MKREAYLERDTGYETRDTKLVVGLGNPGAEYADTRHNLGFKVIDSLAQALGVTVRKRKFAARFGQAEFADKKLILLKPWQFMNCSGQSVTTVVGFYKLTLSNLMVATDDMALEPGRIRIRAKGSAGGHNGLDDIIEKLGTNEFARCRIGIGHPRYQMSDTRFSSSIEYPESSIEYVLDRPSREEKVLLDEAILRARDAVLCWIEHGIEKAMNQFNKP